MDDIPFYKRPWFYITSWLVFLLVVYFWQIYRMGGVEANRNTILQDLFCVFPIFFLIWMAFFSQFVLPVSRFRDRQKIFDRLFRHLTRSHGPAVFIENGQIREHTRETLKRGPGVVWLDSASAAITRTAVAIRKTLGPGVHFTDANEYIEQIGTLDLHTQSQKLGLKDGENAFEEKKDNISQELYDDIQKKRRQVSALSRDGIELVPDISITFRVNTGFPAKNKPGSRFGYRTGTTPEAKILESQDQETIRKALLGEGVNPNINTESSLHRVAWNRLPALLAVDVWREYASKFTLDEIFNQTQGLAVTLTEDSGTSNEDFAAMESPSQVSGTSTRNESTMDRLLRDINNSMERIIHSLEKGEAVTPSNGSTPPPTSSPSSGSQQAPNRTALQIINEMVKARMTQPRVDFMDEYGKRKTGQFASKEFELLQQRGLKVLSVSISNVRLHPTVQETFIKHWAANWLNLSKGESELLDLRRNLIESSAQEIAQCNYAVRLSRDIDATFKQVKPTTKGVLRVILLRTRSMIRSGEFSNTLRRRMVTELQDIDDTIKWMGEDGT